MTEIPMEQQLGTNKKLNLEQQVKNEIKTFSDEVGAFQMAMQSKAEDTIMHYLFRLSLNQPFKVPSKEFLIENRENDLLVLIEGSYGSYDNFLKSQQLIIDQQPSATEVVAKTPILEEKPIEISKDKEHNISTPNVQPIAELPPSEDLQTYLGTPIPTHIPKDIATYLQGKFNIITDKVPKGFWENPFAIEEAALWYVETNNRETFPRTNIIKKENGEVVEDPGLNMYFNVFKELYNGINGFAKKATRVTVDEKIYEILKDNNTKEEIVTIKGKKGIQLTEEQLTPLITRIENGELSIFSKKFSYQIPHGFWSDERCVASVARQYKKHLEVDELPRTVYEGRKKNNKKKLEPIFGKLTATVQKNFGGWDEFGQRNNIPIAAGKRGRKKKTTLEEITQEPKEQPETQSNDESNIDLFVEGINNGKYDITSKSFDKTMLQHQKVAIAAAKKYIELYNMDALPNIKDAEQKSKLKPGYSIVFTGIKEAFNGIYEDFVRESGIIISGYSTVDTSRELATRDTSSVTQRKTALRNLNKVTADQWYKDQFEVNGFSFDGRKMPKKLESVIRTEKEILFQTIKQYTENHGLSGFPTQTPIINGQEDYVYAAIAMGIHSNGLTFSALAKKGIKEYNNKIVINT